MKYPLLFILALTLTACASPTLQMTPAQVASLSDDQLCSYQNNYRDETKLLAEIQRRNVNCDRFFRKCLQQGNQPGSQAMGFCIATLRENERLRYDNDRPWDDGFGIYGGRSIYRHHR